MFELHLVVFLSGCRMSGVAFRSIPSAPLPLVSHSFLHSFVCVSVVYLSESSRLSTRTMMHLPSDVTALSILVVVVLHLLA